MKFWKNTKTLDSLIPELSDPVGVEDAEIAIIGGSSINLAQCPNLKGIFKCGVGTDNVPFEECENRGIKIGLPSSRTADIIYEETASFAAGLIFRMLYADVGTLETWEKRQRAFVRNRKVLLIGQGNIGRRVRDKIERTTEALTFDVLEDEPSVLNDRMRLADVVSLHIPLTPENRNFVDEERLALLKDGAALVNTARGALVDEEALYLELRSGRLRAAFDVYWHEPYSGRLAELHPDRFFMTPHVASSCYEFTNGLARDFREFVSSFSHD